MKLRRPPDDPGDGPRPIGPPPPPADEFPEAEVAIVEVPGLLRCPICRCELEMVRAGREVQPPPSRPPLSLVPNETAPDPKAEGG